MHIQIGREVSKYHGDCKYQQRIRIVASCCCSVRTVAEQRSSHAQVKTLADLSRRATRKEAGRADKQIMASPNQHVQRGMQLVFEYVFVATREKGRFTETEAYALYRLVV